MFSSAGSIASRPGRAFVRPPARFITMSNTLNSLHDGCELSISGYLDLPVAPPGVLGSRWRTSIRNVGTRRLQFVPQAGLVDSLAKVPLWPGQGCDLSSDSVGLITRGRPARWRVAQPILYKAPSGGSDLNDGLHSSAPLATGQEAATRGMFDIDTGNGTVVIQIMDGIHTAWNVNVITDTLGGNQLAFQGNAGDASLVELQAVGGDIFYGKDKGVYVVRNLTYAPQASGIRCQVVEQLSASNMEGTIRFKSCPGGTLGYASTDASLLQRGTVQLIGGSVGAHASCTAVFQAAEGGRVDQASLPIVVTGYWDWLYFLYASGPGSQYTRSTGTIDASGATVTGKRFQSQLNACINSNSAGLNFMPGDTPGDQVHGGRYL